MHLLEESHRRLQDQHQDECEYHRENNFAREIARREEHDQKLTTLKNCLNISLLDRLRQFFCLDIGLRRIGGFHQQIYVDKKSCLFTRSLVVRAINSLKQECRRYRRGSAAVPAPAVTPCRTVPGRRTISSRRHDTH